MDDYKEIITILEKIKDNPKALAYIKGFLQVVIKRYK